MQDAILAAQQTLIEHLEDEDWEVTDAELSVYESPWDETDEPEATITLTARRLFPRDESGDNPYRVK